jgi:outer membrane lipoprotein-sorting protein
MPWTFKAIATLAVAVSVLVCLVLSDSTGISRAFAEVAEALENLRTATYDVTMEIKDPMNEKTTTITMKAFFLAPSRERIEMSMSLGSAKDKGSSIMILDHQAMKGLTLAPEQKLATTIDLSKIKKPAGPSNLFEMVRQLVREGSSGPGKKIESLGKKEIDGRVAVGFRTHSNLADIVLWADPQTSRLVRVEVDYPGGSGHGVMSNFRYDMELDPSLFSIEPPAGYIVNNMDVKMPVEDDLINTLRIVAEHNDGTFPSALSMSNKEYQQVMQAVSKEEMEKYVKTPDAEKLLEKLKTEHGSDQAAFMKAWMEAIMPITQKLVQEHQQGMMFYNMLTAQNDSHYAGKNVKLGTPDRPIFWYKPIGAEKYRIIYADLSVKEVPSEELPKAIQSESIPKP